MYNGIIHNAHWFLSFGQFVVQPQSVSGAALPLFSLLPLRPPLSMPLPLPRLPSALCYPLCAAIKSSNSKWRPQHKYKKKSNYSCCGCKWRCTLHVASCCSLATALNFSQARWQFSSLLTKPICGDLLHSTPLRFNTNLQRMLRAAKTRH